MAELLDITKADIPDVYSSRSGVSWFTWPVIIPLGILPAIIIVATPMQYMMGSLLAYLNCLVCGAAMVHFVRQRTLEGLVPVLFLAWMMLSWPVSSIYFAGFFPEMTYQLISWQVKNLHGNVRLQSVLLLFLVSYLSVAFLMIRKPRITTQMQVSRRTARQVATVSLWISIIAFSINACSKVVQFPVTVEYFANAFFIYLNGLLLVVGCYFGFLSKATKILTIVFMAACAFFYTLGNARGMAIAPISIFLIGLLFCADLSQKWKLWVIVMILVGGPLYMVVGETTRRILGAGGFTNLAMRYQTLSRWDEMLTDTPVLAATFGRLFFTGGHSIITLTPGEYAYLPFSLHNYVIELFARLLPGKFYYSPFYSTNAHLLRYGFRIIEGGTSVEISLLGSLWMLGGPLFIVTGGIVTALIHGYIAHFLRKARHVSVHKAIFYLSMLAPLILWWPNLDIISNFRTLVWHIFIGAFLYYLCIHWLVVRENQEVDNSWDASASVTSFA